MITPIQICTHSYFELCDVKDGLFFCFVCVCVFLQQPSLGYDGQASCQDSLTEIKQDEKL